MPQRYFLDELNHEINGQDAHHIKHVMRMHEHDEIIVCSRGKCFLAMITSVEHDVTYSIVKELEAETSMHITLIQGLPKGSKNEFVAKYATIFGVSEIVFVPMKRSIAKLENIENKQKRLSLIAKEAAELAHRFDVPEIRFENKLKNIDYQAFDFILLADENNKSTTLDQLNLKDPNSKKIALVIGPEGGLDDSERQMFEDLHATSISLGKNILPTEAACLYALSYLSLQKS